MVRKENINEPELDKTNKITCAPSKYSDQPGHLTSLIIVLLWLGLQVLMKRLAQTVLSSLGAQVMFWFCHAQAQITEIYFEGKYIGRMENR